jgi:pimeloyl-[acyl-carrier protein] synthase
MREMDQDKKTLRFSVRSPEYIRDPYFFYKLLRERDPVYFSPDGYWFLTTYQDVSAGLKNPSLRNSPAPFSLLNSRNVGKYIAADVANRLVAFLDPPDHFIPRRIISGSFQDFVAEKSRAIELVAANCVDAIGDKKEIDFVKDFSIPYSAHCIAEFFGIGAEWVNRLPYWADMVFHLFHSFPSRDVFQQVNDGIGQFRNFMLGCLNESRKRGRNDFFAQMMNAEYRNTRLSDDQIVDNAMLICADAIGNVHNGLTTALLTLLLHQDQLNQLKNNLDLLPSAIDECLRFESPAQYQGRVAGEDLEVKGRKIRKHSVVLLAIGSANRDPDFIQNPDRFDICRPKTRNLSFGLGPHRCIGIGLVKIGFESALRKLFQSDLKLRLMEQETKWIARAGHRWPQSLKLHVN